MAADGHQHKGGDMIAIRILSISFLLIASASAAKAGTKDDAGGPLPAPLIDIPGKETRKSTPATETGSTDSNDKSGAVKSTTGEG